MAKSYAKAKGRSQGKGRFFMLPLFIRDSPNYPKLKHASVRLLTDIGIQYTGGNNGDFCATLSLLKKHGWTSSGSIDKSVKELIHYGFIQLTRQGGRNQCSLYAITWQPINECKGKLDVRETITPSNLYKEDKPLFQYSTKKTKSYHYTNRVK